MKKLLVVFIILLSACNKNLEPLNVQSNIKLPANFENLKNSKNQVQLREWWKNWNDEVLNNLINEGIKNNYDILIARNRLQEAMANANLAYADLGAKAELSGGAGAAASQIDTKIMDSDSKSANLNLGISASWEVDFWGKKRADLEASLKSAFAQEQEIYATQILITAEIAKNYFNIHKNLGQISLIQEQIKQLENLKKYLKGRFNAGQLTALELDELEAKISQVSAQIPLLKAQIGIFEKNIGILLGKVSAFKIEIKGNLLAKIPPPPQGLKPSSLLERRPDIIARKAIIDARAAKLKSAKLDLYPRFNIQFLSKGARIELDNDLSPLMGFGSILSASVHLPIFTNGRIKANIEKANIELRTAILEYDKSLIKALGEVETSYLAQYGLISQTERLTSALKLAEKQHLDSFKLFKYGSKTLDTVINSQISAIQIKLNILNNQYQKAENLLNIYKSLGGGW